MLSRRDELDNLLRIEQLEVFYETSSGRIKALNNVSLEIEKNELLAVVGESGCGKTTLGLSVIGLLPARTAKVTNGSIHYKGSDLLLLDQDSLRQYRGTEIAMIFQEPLTSLDPVYKVGDQIAEAILVGQLRKKRSTIGEGAVVRKAGYVSGSRLPRIRWNIAPELKNEIIEWLRLVRIADPEQVLDRYPFELSGGMMQRVMIAMALSQEPALLIADEPTTALDVTTQAQVLKLMRELMDKLRTSILLITHDLAVASQVANRIVVMYAGEIVEDANVFDIFSEPLHPYTQGLLSCIPSGSKDGTILKPISGTIPDMRNLPDACKFAPRCPYAMQICQRKRPPLIEEKKRHEVSCFLYGQ